MIGTTANRYLSGYVQRESAALIIDSAVRSRLEPGVLESFPTHAVVSSAVSLVDLERFSSKLGQEGIDRVVAVGGGNTIDLAKLSAGCAVKPGLLQYLLAVAPGTGFAPVPTSLWDPLDVVVVPTTIGTGAEVSHVACCLTDVEGASYKTLVSLPFTPVSQAIYDEQMLCSPIELYRAGIAEIFTRVFVSLVCSSSVLAMSDRIGMSLARETLELAVRSLVSGVPLLELDILQAALVSAESHSSWFLLGRGAVASPLWLVANELSVVAGVSKVQALVALFSRWLDIISSGVAPIFLGGRERLQDVLSGLGISSREVSLLIGQLVVEAPRTFDDMSKSALRGVAERVVSRFGGGRPLPRDVCVADFSLLLGFE